MESILAHLASAQSGLVSLATQNGDTATLLNLSVAQAGLVAIAQSMTAAEPVVMAMSAPEPEAEAVAPAVVSKPKPKRKYTRRACSARSTSSNESDAITDSSLPIENYTTQFTEIPQWQKDIVSQIDNPKFDPVQIAVLIHDNAEHPEQKNIYYNKKQVHIHREGRWISQDLDDSFVTELIRKLALLYFMREDRQQRMILTKSGTEYAQGGYILSECKNDKDAELYDQWVLYAQQLKSVLQSFYRKA